MCACLQMSTCACVMYTLNRGLSLRWLSEGILIVRFTKPAADSRASSFSINILNEARNEIHLPAAPGDKACAAFMNNNRQRVLVYTACVSFHAYRYHSHTAELNLTPHTETHGSILLQMYVHLIPSLWGNTRPLALSHLGYVDYPCRVTLIY